MKLRDYQVAALEFCKKRKGNLLLSIATGKGKSVLSLELIKDHLENQKGNILVLCPTQIIRQQLHNLYKSKVETKIIDCKNGLAKSRVGTARVFICCYPTYQSLTKNELSFLLTISLLIIDEVHKVNTKTILGKLIMKISQLTTLRKIGLTATPGSKRNLKEIKEVLSCSSEDVYSDHNPLYEKKERVIELTTSLWRLSLIESITEDLINNFCLRYNLPLKFSQFHFNTREISKRGYLLTSYYMILNKLNRLIHGATPFRISSYYQKNIKACKLPVCNCLSSKTIKLLSNLELETDQRFNFLYKESLNKRIIFVDDILVGQELRSVIPNCYFISSKDKREVRGIIRKLSKEKTFTLVATSIAEEGLNLNLDEVLNFEVPTTKIKLEQRRGRVGRYNKGVVTYFNLPGTYGSSLINRYSIKNHSSN